MNKIKTTYERPTTDILVIRFEGALLQASLYGAKGAAGGTMDTNDYGEDDGDLF